MSKLKTLRNKLRDIETREAGWNSQVKSCTGVIERAEGKLKELKKDRLEVTKKIKAEEKRCEQEKEKAAKKAAARKSEEDE